MPKSNYSATLEEVMNLPLPIDTLMDTHQAIKQEIDILLQAQGLIISKEEYRMANKGEFVQGIYTFENSKDGYNLTFSWVSTYNKTAGFKSSFGASDGNVHFMITSKNNPQLKRVSIESTLQHVTRLVNKQINTSQNLFDEITSYITSSEYSIILDRLDTSQLTGELFFNDLITVTQLTKLREAMSSKLGVKTNKSFSIPLVSYNMCILLATQMDNKPYKWIRSGIGVTDFLINYGKSIPELDENTDTEATIKFTDEEKSNVSSHTTSVYHVDIEHTIEPECSINLDDNTNLVIEL